MAVQEFETWITSAQLNPKSPNPEVIAADIRIVKEDNCSVRQLRQPVLKVSTDSFVCVKAIYVQ